MNTQLYNNVPTLPILNAEMSLMYKKLQRKQSYCKTYDFIYRHELKLSINFLKKWCGL